MNTKFHLRPTQTSICPIFLTYSKVLFTIHMPVKTDFSSAEAHLLLHDNNDPMSDNDGAKEIVPLSQVCNHYLQLPVLLFNTDPEVNDSNESHQNIQETNSDMCADLAKAITSSIFKNQGYFAVHIHSSVIDPSMQCFTLNIVLKHNKETLVIQSEPVRIVKHKLCIQLNIHSAASNITQIGHSQTFVFFHAHGGDNRPIDCWIHLKDSIGRIVNNFDKPIHLVTSLVYEDGTRVPPGFKGKVYTTKKTRQNLDIYRRLRPDPVLDGTTDTASAFFSFRIEEVSFRHDPHSGFKLYVIPYDEDGNVLTDIAPGIMEEVIVVKCRPAKSIKNDEMKSGSKIGGRRTIMQKALGGIPVVLRETSWTSNQKQSVTKNKTSAVPSQKSSWSTEDNNVQTPKMKKPNLDTDMSAISSHSPSISEFDSSECMESGLYVKYDDETDSLMMNNDALEALFVGINNDENQCLFCNASIPHGNGLRPLDHEIECRGSLAMAPYIRKESF